MENSTQISAVNTLEAEGFALAKEWKSICRADKSRFTKSTKADGFDTRLGKLMFALKQEAGGRIQSARLKDCGINSIDKRRRSEALWFVENEDAARDFIQASKKGFTSLTALQAAMRKSAKADETPEQSETEDKSNVGPNEPQVQEQAEPKTAGDIALEAILQAELHNVSIADLEVALQDAINLLKEDNIKAVA
jgi:hypothetical protein